MQRAHFVRGLILASGLALGLALPGLTLSGQTKEPDSTILKGSPLGAVKFEHKLHAKDRKIKCDTCHHASKPEKALKAEHQKCTDCHTKTAAPPMKTNPRGAFHDATAKKGLCADCHLAENAKGKKAPAKCPDCHKKANG